MAIGGEWWGDSDEQKSIETIRAAVDAGITLVDTAPCYGFGQSEKVVGKALKGIRDKVILSTKCGLWWHDERGSNALAEPEKHKDIIVRVGVFSDNFVMLSKDIQNEIIKRTQHTV